MRSITFYAAYLIFQPPSLCLNGFHIGFPGHHLWRSITLYLSNSRFFITMSFNLKFFCLNVIPKLNFLSSCLYPSFFFLLFFSKDRLFQCFSNLSFPSFYPCTSMLIHFGFYQFLFISASLNRGFYQFPFISASFNRGFYQILSLEFLYFFISRNSFFMYNHSRLFFFSTLFFLSLSLLDFLGFLYFFLSFPVFLCFLSFSFFIIYLFTYLFYSLIPFLQFPF